MVLALLIATAAVWFIWLPHHRPGLTSGERYGIDVSHHQGEIDWLRVARDEIGFTYIKASEGGDHLDPRFEENWRGAGLAGLDRGAYHYFTLCRDGEVQARNFLRAVPSDLGDLAPAVDLELAGNCSARPQVAAVMGELTRFLEVVEGETAREMVLYVGSDFEEIYPTDALGRRRWCLSFLRRPASMDCSVWQVMGFASVRGIQGRVDLNVAGG